jgi:hypothetical protein
MLMIDLEATFMRMKEDHMLNGQLKPAYNVQVAVENYFIIHSYVSNDRTDYNTLIPVLKKHKEVFGSFPEETTADSGYCSEKNLLYLKENRITSYIKLQDHEKRKARAYKEDIGKYYNMKNMIFEDEHYYVCHDGRELRHIRTPKPASRRVMSRRLKFTDAQTAAVVNINPDACINTMRKRIRTKIRS